MTVAAPAARRYTTREVLDHSGLSYRQVDYWARCGVIDRVGAVRWDPNPGSGRHRYWNADHLHALRVCARLNDVLTSSAGSTRGTFQTEILVAAVQALRTAEWPTSGWLLVAADASFHAATLEELDAILGDWGWVILPLLPLDRPAVD